MKRFIIAFVHCVVYAVITANVVESFYDRSNNVSDNSGFMSEGAREKTFQSAERSTMKELHDMTSKIRSDILRRKLSNTKLDNLLTDLMNIYPMTNSSISAFRMVDDKVLVDVVGYDADTIEAALKSGGFSVISCYERMCSMYSPVDKLDELAAIPQIASIRAATPMTQQARVISEGVFAMYVDRAVSKHKVNGTGITIGVLSNSFDCLKQASDDVRSGNLPSLNNINVLADLTGPECIAGTDEGRAMMQIIHDVAPGAKLAFHTANRGKADFANGIRKLANAGCDIIVDDIGYLDDAYFQDGIIAQAVDDVVLQGAAYFSAVGNDGRNAWDAPGGFVRSGILFDNATGSEFHKFGENSDGSPIVSQRIRFSSRTQQALFYFQWDQPHFSISGGSGCRNNVDIFITYNKTVVASGSYSPNVGSDPIERLLFFPSTLGERGPEVVVEVFIVHVSGERARYMKLMAYTGGREVVFEFGQGSTIFGHPNAASAAAVGAASFFQTPAYNASHPLIAPYSSVGGTPVLIDKLGNRQSKKKRKQPKVTGPDAVLTTFFPPTPGSTNRFFGSSAAAPHVAAVAALLLDKKGGPKTIPTNKIYNILQRSAIDMDDPSTVGFDYGFDFNTGYGFVNALGALDIVTCSLSWNFYNSNTDAFVTPLTNNVVISNPPPCGSANIELIVPCGTALPVDMELFQITTTGSTGIRIAGKRKQFPDYFLFENNGTDIFGERISPGNYSVRANINGKYSPRVKFAIGGGSCK